MSRIGLRFLVQHHIESLTNRPGHSGILQLDCSPAEVVRKCAEDSCCKTAKPSRGDIFSCLKLCCVSALHQHCKFTPTWIRSYLKSSTPAVAQHPWITGLGFLRRVSCGSVRSQHSTEEYVIPVPGRKCPKDYTALRRPIKCIR
eukprot:5675851-Amphidinium_carterae.1